MFVLNRHRLLTNKIANIDILKVLYSFHALLIFLSIVLIMIMKKCFDVCLISIFAKCNEKCKPEQNKI